MLELGWALKSPPFYSSQQANLNQVLNKLEDPEMVITQAVVDLQGDLVKIRQSYAEVGEGEGKRFRGESNQEKLVAKR